MWGDNSKKLEHGEGKKRPEGRAAELGLGVAAPGPEVAVGGDGEGVVVAGGDGGDRRGGEGGDSEGLVGVDERGEAPHGAIAVVAEAPHGAHRRGCKAVEETMEMEMETMEMVEGGGGGGGGCSSRERRHWRGGEEEGEGDGAMKQAKGIFCILPLSKNQIYKFP